MGIGICLIVFPRILTYGEAFERDLMAYGVIADGLNQGRALYSDMWDHKPPAIHWTYALFMGIFGYNSMALFAMGLFAAILSFVGIYYLGWMIRGPAAGLIAALLWALFGGDLYLQANQPNVEVFINVALIIAFALTVHAQKNQGSVVSILVGLFFFLASLYKTVAAAVAIAIVGVQICLPLMYWGRSSYLERGFLSSVSHGGKAFLAAMAGWMGIGFYFWWIKDFKAFYASVFSFNQIYAGSILENLFKGFTFTVHPPLVYSYIILFGITLCGVVLLLFTPSARNSDYNWDKGNCFLLLGYMVGVWVAMALPGKYFPHYYQLLLPPLVIGFAILLVYMWEERRHMAMALLSLLLVLPLSSRVYESFLPLMDVPVYKYGQWHG
ncbi:MAG: glycosyltransferase family 39 protein, partial [Desulfobacterales bacterium]|nr:glycosyltransferase family 39 protein [Desulfobacterales bacterium]